MFSFININSRRAKSISALGLAAISLFQSNNSTKCIAAEDDRVTMLKRKVGFKAVDDYVSNGMIVGMGTGSTCYFSLDRLDQLLKQHKLKEITVIPCSEFTKKVKNQFTFLLSPNHNLYQQCIARNIPITTLSHVAANNLNVDIVIDGVDEIDPDLQMSKGGSGCLLREKMIEKAATKVNRQVSNHRVLLLLLLLLLLRFLLLLLLLLLLQILQVIRISY